MREGFWGKKKVKKGRERETVRATHYEGTDEELEGAHQGPLSAPPKRTGKSIVEKKHRGSFNEHRERSCTEEKMNP